MKLAEYVQQHYSKTSAKTNLNCIKNYELAMAGRAGKATYSEVVAYIGSLRAQGKHPKTLRNHLYAIKIYYRYLLHIGKRSDHPCSDLYLKDQINRAVEVEDFYPKTRLRELYESFETPADKRHKSLHRSVEAWQAVQKRDKIILSLLIYQALTPLEIVNLRVEDIALKAATISIYHGHYPTRQPNKDRTLSLHPKQLFLFADYLKKERKLFWRMQKPRKRKAYFILSESGLQLGTTHLNRMLKKGRKPENQFTPMKIRQSVIAHLIKEKHDIRIVQEFAGHRRTASTEAYQQTGLEELKIAIDKLHPLQ